MKQALKAAAAINYTGAGTVEFLLDYDGKFYFMEMNTRLQVEHPVTEMITGQDLVEWQLRVASGETLPCSQDQLQIKGHAFEARVYAEDPDNDFLPATGTLHLLQPPVESEHVRVDTGVSQGDEVSVYYDPMIAKLIVWDESRDKALSRMAKALSEYHVEGVTTNIDFLYNLASCKPFRDADLTTNFIEQHEAAIYVEDEQDIQPRLPLMALYLVLSRQNEISTGNEDTSSPWQMNNHWRANEVHNQSLEIAIQDKTYQLKVSQSGVGSAKHFDIVSETESFRCHGELNGEQMIANINGHRSKSTVIAQDKGYSLFTADTVIKFEQVMPDLGLMDHDDAHGGFTAPMNGTVVSLLVEPGQLVEKDQPLMIMEAMKMEHTLKASSAGKVTEFYYQPGELVDGGAELLSFEDQE